MISSAWSYTAGSSAVHVELSDAVTTCEEQNPRGRMQVKGQKYVTLTFAPVLQADGTRRWSPTRLLWEGREVMPGFEGEGLMGLTIKEPVEGQPVELELNYQTDLKANEAASWAATRLELHGAVSAPSCGIIELEAPGAIVQDKLVATLGGAPLPILGAILTNETDDTCLVLTTGPNDCRSGFKAQDVELCIYMKVKHKERYVHVSGDIFPIQQTDLATLDGLEVTVDKADPTAFTLNGSYKIMDTTFALRGPVKALDCRGKLKIFDGAELIRRDSPAHH
jgi:hypothetical protein